jgi:hypothetical protein
MDRRDQTAINIRKLYKVSNPLKNLDTASPVVTATADLSYYSVPIHFSSANFTSTDGSWSLSTADTSHFICNQSGTYTIVWNINNEQFNVCYFWMQYNNDASSMYATQNNPTSRDLFYIHTTLTQSAGQYINFFGGSQSSLGSCSYGTQGTCTVNIYRGTV